MAALKEEAQRILDELKRNHIDAPHLRTTIQAIIKGEPITTDDLEHMRFLEVDPKIAKIMGKGEKAFSLRFENELLDIIKRAPGPKKR